MYSVRAEARFIGIFYQSSICASLTLLLAWFHMFTQLYSGVVQGGSRGLPSAWRPQPSSERWARSRLRVTCSRELMSMNSCWALRFSFMDLEKTNPISPCSAEETSRVRPSTEGGGRGGHLRPHRARPRPGPPASAPRQAPSGPARPSLGAGPAARSRGGRGGPGPASPRGEGAARPRAAPLRAAGGQRPPPPPPIGRRSRAGRGAGPGRAS